MNATSFGRPGCTCDRCRRGLPDLNPDGCHNTIPALPQLTQQRPGTAAALSPFIGRTALLMGPGIRPAVTILDARMVWGQVQFLVRPLAGQGEQWISERGLQVQPGKARVIEVEVR